MKITNNRSKGAWFNFRVNGMPKREYFKPYETRELVDYNDINQSSHNRTISNFSAEKPAADSGQTTVVVSTKKTAEVDNNKVIGVAQQTDGNFEVKYTSQD